MYGLGLSDGWYCLYIATGMEKCIGMLQIISSNVSQWTHSDYEVMSKVWGRYWGSI